MLCSLYPFMHRNYLNVSRKAATASCPPSLKKYAIMLLMISLENIAFCWGLPFEHIFYVDLRSEVLGIRNSCKCTLHTWRPVPAFDPVHQQCPHLLPPPQPEPSPPPAGPWQQPPSGGSHPTLLCCSAHSCLGVSKACAPSRCALVL